MSLHKLTAGDGYTYLTRQVAASDGTERRYTLPAISARHQRQWGRPARAGATRRRRRQGPLPTENPNNPSERPT